MKTPELTPPEEKYLEKMRELEIKNQPFSHRTMCSFFGWSSVSASWQVVQSLARKGVVNREGKRLAVVECPTINGAGRMALGERTAA